MIELKPVYVNGIYVDLEKRYEELKEQLVIQGDIVVLPEFFFTGYFPKDLLYDPTYVQKSFEYTLKLLEEVNGNRYRIFVFSAPYIDYNKQLRNAGIVYEPNSGKILPYFKKALPTYNIFEEYRYFVPGEKPGLIFQVNDKKYGVLVCEDAWIPSHIERLV